MSHELTAHGRARVVDNGHRHIAHYLIVVYPGVKQRIEQGHEDEKYKHTFVTDGLPHLFRPNAAGVDHSAAYLVYDSVFSHHVKEYIRM